MEYSDESEAILEENDGDGGWVDRGREGVMGEDDMNRGRRKGREEETWQHSEENIRRS